jgi:hypothetical protein
LICLLHKGKAGQDKESNEGKGEFLK